MSNWYVIKVLSGKERQLNKQFNEDISSGKIKNIIRFICPTDEKYTIIRNKRVLKESVIYNGYLYFEAEKLLTDDELKYIGTFPSIIGLFGNKKPILLNKTDVEKILKDDELFNHVDSKRLKFIEGESVILTESPFNGFSGEIKSVSGDKVELEVKIFDRVTKLTLNVDQIIKK